jgi:hypothetical protein
MGTIRRVWPAAVVALVVIGATACAPPPPPPKTTVDHVTVWEADVPYAETSPAIVSWVGYGSYLYNLAPTAAGQCNPLDEGTGFSSSFTRIDPATVRVRVTLDWVEGRNTAGRFGCGVEEELNAGLLDGTGSEVAFALLPLVSHT